MKSERAKAIIYNDTKDSGIFTEDTVFAIVEEAVELAEEDARERAVKAYCKSAYGVFCDDCDSCDFDADTCERRNEYLKSYDNEE